MDFSAEQLGLQTAIDAAHAAGGGRVVVSPGRMTTGTLVLRSNVELHLERGAVLLGSTDLDDYSPLAPAAMTGDLRHDASGYRLLGLITAERAENFAITGAGTIDMRGPEFFDTSAPTAAEIAADPTGSLVRGMYRKPAHPRPRMLVFSECRGIRISGVTLKDSPSWTSWIAECEDLDIRDVCITGDQRMINNDGIHLDSCRRVVISGCRIATGDDALVIRAIPKDSSRRQSSCNVAVSNCVLDSACQAIRIGCPNDGAITDVTISNVVLRGYNGIAFDNPHRYLVPGAATRLFTDRIVISSVAIEVTGRPIWIEAQDGVGLDRLGGVSFSAVRMRGGLPCRFCGSAETELTDVRFDAVVFDRAPEMRRCRGFEFNHCRIDAD